MIAGRLRRLGIHERQQGRGQFIARESLVRCRQQQKILGGPEGTAAALWRRGCLVRLRQEQVQISTGLGTATAIRRIRCPPEHQVPTGFDVANLRPGEIEQAVLSDPDPAAVVQPRRFAR